jgi:nucleotide-binding universal stress UspA family protein
MYCESCSGSLARSSLALPRAPAMSVPLARWSWHSMRFCAETDCDDRAPLQPLERRILVPLDGSKFAEKALPLAQQLAGEWNAEIWLASVVFTMAEAPSGAKLNPTWVPYEEIEPQKREAEAYLREVAAKLQGQVHTQVLLGSPVDELVAAAEAWGISDVVLASHGQTGLSRVILGSVADALIHHLDLPIIVVPAHASQPAETAMSEMRSESGAGPA